MNLNDLRVLPAYQQVITQITQGQKCEALGLARSVRTVIASLLHGELQQPIVVLTGRNDHALKWVGELDFWLKETPHYLFPEPSPLFYEQAAWGTNNRRDRLR